MSWLARLRPRPLRFAVLLPVTRPPAMLPFAIESVLAQTVPDFELLVICDGAPAETVACAREYTRRDRRVRVFPFPKGERHGEAHRHAALQQARGRYVAQIADDDLWLPDHLEKMEQLLADFDFGHSLHCDAQPDGHSIVPLIDDVGAPATRARMLNERFNFFGPSSTGYRIEAYRRLPEGWAPAPPGTWTDLHMWRKFFRCGGLRFATNFVLTTVHFPSPVRKHMSLAERAAENRAWFERIRRPEARDDLRRQLALHLDRWKAAAAR